MTKHNRHHIRDVLGRVLAAHFQLEESTSAALIADYAFEFVMSRHPGIGSEGMTAAEETRLRAEVDEVVDTLCQIVAAAMVSTRGAVDAVDP